MSTRLDMDLYRDHLVTAYFLARALMELPLAEMRDAISHAETVAPFIDPTALLRNGKKLREDAKVIGILARAAHELEQLPWPNPAEVKP